MDQLTLQGRVAKLFVAVIVGLVIALALQIAGFATTGWYVVNFKDGWRGISIPGGRKFEAGLWATKVCIAGNCATVDHTELDNKAASAISTELLEYQVETSIALGLLVIVIVMYSCMRCESCSGNMKTNVYCTVFFTLISGILAVVAAGRTGNEVRKAHDGYKLLYGESPYEVPYSVILTGIGGLLAGVMALVILFSVQPWKNDSVPPPSYEMTAKPNV